MLPLFKYWETGRRERYHSQRKKAWLSTGWNIKSLDLYIKKPEEAPLLCYQWNRDEGSFAFKANDDRSTFCWRSLFLLFTGEMTYINWLDVCVLAMENKSYFFLLFIYYTAIKAKIIRREDCSTDKNYRGYTFTDIRPGQGLSVTANGKAPLICLHTGAGVYNMRVCWIIWQMMRMIVMAWPDWLWQFLSWRASGTVEWDTAGWTGCLF